MSTPKCALHAATTNTMCKKYEDTCISLSYTCICALHSMPGDKAVSEKVMLIWKMACSFAKRENKCIHNRVSVEC